MPNDLTLELEPKARGKEERQVLNELKRVLERQRRKISSIRLAGLATTALRIVLRNADRPEDRVAMALARGITARQRLAVEEGGSVSSQEAAHFLGISKTAVLKRLQAGRLLGWRGERQGAVRFPAWQFDEGRVLPGLQQVLEILNRDPRLDDWGKVLFFLHTSSRLGDRRPLDLLREKKLREVMLVAEAYAE